MLRPLRNFTLRTAHRVLAPIDPQLRVLTARQRRLPDFCIIGAQKSGTSSLYHYLAAHPDIGRALTKEVHYFDAKYHHGDLWYRRHFPLRVPGACRLTGEATPAYLMHPLVPARMHALVPQCRLIVLLRDPVERAFSHWRHMVRMGVEPLSFEEALDAEAARIEPSLRRFERGEERLPEFMRHSYVYRGLYAEQLERWWALFPRERTLVLRAEDLFADPAGVFARTLDFLGLELPVRPPEFTVYNRGPEGELSDATWERLRQTFREPNARLAALTGIAF